jgi:hypothetical protein
MTSPPPTAPPAPMTRSMDRPKPFPSRLLPATHPTINPTRMQNMRYICFPLSRNYREKERQASRQNKVTRLDATPTNSRSGGGSSYLMKGRVGDHVGVDAHSSLDYAVEEAGHLFKRRAIVALRIFAGLPETVRVNLFPALRDEREFIEKTLLLPEERNSPAASDFKRTETLRANIRLSLRMPRESSGCCGWPERPESTLDRNPSVLYFTYIVKLACILYCMIY